MFEEYYRPLPDVETYLKRIGLEGLQFDNSLEQLNLIIKKHVEFIPFENLDAWYLGKVPDLTPEGLYNKIILHKRGGWCHELNGLFLEFLKAFGYEAYACAGRLFQKGGLTPLGHRGVVCVIDGLGHYCDVGLGARCYGTAIPFDGTVTKYGYYCKPDGGWMNIYKGERKIERFAPIPFEPMDFVAPNFVDSTDPEAHFKAHAYVSIIIDGRRFLLNDNLLCEGDDDHIDVIREVNTLDEKMKLIREMFRIEI